jgi:hypothetical protein
MRYRVYFTFLFLFSACSGTDPEPADLVDAGSSAHQDAGSHAFDGGEQQLPACVPDQDLLELSRSCDSDEHCPCSSHCAEGACAHECVMGDDCGGGGVCDQAGRCPGARPRVAPGFLHVLPSDVALIDREHVRRLHVTAKTAPVTRGSVIPGPGVWVSCDGGEPAPVPCLLAELPVGSTTQLAVRLDPDSDQNWGIVRIAHAGGERRVEVRIAPGVVERSPSREGKYEGTLQLLGYGEDENIEGGLRLPVTVRIFDQGRRRFVLEDHLGYLVPAHAEGKAEIIGRIEGGEEPRLLLEPFGHYPIEELHVRTEGESTDFRWQGAGVVRTVAFEFQLRPTTVRTRWRLTLSRVGDLGTGERSRPTVPAPAADAAAAQDRFAATERLEASIGENFTRYRVGGGDPVSSLFRCAAPGVGVSLDCGDSACTPAFERDNRCEGEAQSICLPFQPPCFMRYTCRMLGMENDPPIGTSTRPQSCAQRYLCYAHDADDSLGADSQEFGNNILPVSGDLACGLSGLAPALGLAQNQDRDPGDRRARGAMLSACIGDLAKMDDLLSGADFDLAAALQNNGCLGALPLLAAFDHASGPARAAAAGDQLSSNSDADALAARILGQWIASHRFLALQALESEIASAAVNREDRGVDLDGVQSRLAAGGRFLLNPKVVSFLTGVSTEALQEADYRQRLQPGFAGQGLGNHDQTLPLPVMMAEGMAAEIALLARVLERTQFAYSAAATAQVIPRVGGALRHSILLEGLLLRLVERSGVEDLAAVALSDLRTQRSLLANRLTALRAQRNPLGIEDDDLPIHLNTSAEDPADRYFGSSRRLVSELDAKVSAARSALSGARNAYSRMLSQQDQSENRQDRRAGLAERYGNQILALCGSEDPDASAEGALSALGDAEPVAYINGCFLRDHPAGGGAACKEDLAETILSTPVQDLAFEFCVKAELYKDFSPLATPHDPKGFWEAAGRVVGGWLDAAHDGIGGLLHTLGFSTRGGDLERLATIIGGAAWDPTRTLMENQALLDRARSICAEQLPEAVPGALRLRMSALVPDASRPDCFQGQLGEAALAAVAAEQQAQTANQAISDLHARYDHAVVGCKMSAAAQSDRGELQRRHDDSMAKLNLVKSTADFLAGEMTFDTGAANFFTFGGRAAIKGVGVAVGVAMTAAEDSHRRMMQEFESQVQLSGCLHGAEAHLIGIKSATMNLARAQLDMQRALNRLVDLKTQAVRLINDGRNALERERSRSRARVGEDPWLAEELTTFARQMRSARRHAYLVVRAAEYELQQTRGAARAAVLSAELPDDLSAGLEALRADLNNGQIGGQVPDAPQRVVLSLRQEVLRLANQGGADAPAGEKALTSQSRFRALLRHPRFQYQDGNGVGIRLPFTLQPRGEGQGAAIFSTNHCAERIWSVDLAVTGVNPLGDAMNIPQVMIERSNTFSSRYCDGAGDGAEMQVQSFNPARNLFRDAISDAGALGSPSEPRRRRATLQPSVNPAPAVFRDQGGPGKSETFAGFGLYGDYALLIPASSLNNAVEGWLAEGLDDILIRVEFTQFPD